MAIVNFTINHSDRHTLTLGRVPTAGPIGSYCCERIGRHLRYWQVSDIIHGIAYFGELGLGCGSSTPSSTAAAATSGEDKCGSGDQGENKRQSGAAETCMHTDGMMILKHHPMMLATRLIFPGAGFTSL